MPQGHRLSVLLQRARRRHSGRRSLAAAAADAMVEGLERKGGDGSRSPRARGSAIASGASPQGDSGRGLHQVKPQEARRQSHRQRRLPQIEFATDSPQGTETRYPCTHRTARLSFHEGSGSSGTQGGWPPLGLGVRCAKPNLGNRTRNVRHVVLVIGLLNEELKARGIKSKSWTSASGRRWISSAAQGPKVRRLPAGGEWIRTSGSAMRSLIANRAALVAAA